MLAYSTVSDNSNFAEFPRVKSCRIALLPDLTGSVLLDGCALLKDITGIGNAERIIISNCPRLTIVTLINVKVLTFVCCQQFSGLGNNELVELNDCPILARFSRSIKQTNSTENPSVPFNS
jgi:hypothetical protein